MSFSDVVEAIKSLTHKEKREIQILLTQYLKVERREEIYNNYQLSRIEEQNGELAFFSNIAQLKDLRSTSKD